MSNAANKTRQELYQKIRESSKDEVILDEMKRLGFWPKDEAQPSLSESLIKEKGELQLKLRELGRQQALYDDPERALKELHKQRKKAALEKREETRIARNKLRYDRAQRWYETQQKMITYLGDKHWLSLRAVDSDTSRLSAQQLPLLHSSHDLAEVMGISLNELRFLAYQKDVTKISHYQRFEISKKTGGTRLISAPMPRLKRAQYWILGNILEPLPLHNAAHGFVNERSIVTNALPHVGKDVVINLDLKDFFPSVSYPRVKGVFQNLGYSEHVATVLGLLCTESNTQHVELDQEQWFISNGERFLPQGAPTSPYITNLICRKLDARLEGMARALGFEYTRYADDLTFSASNVSDAVVRQLLWRCRGIVMAEGFNVHPDKTRIMRRHQQQEVTGVVVNEKPSVDRKTLKRFRALLFQIEKDGPADKAWGCGELFASIEGYANFVAMVKPEKGIALQQQVTRLRQQYGQPVKAGKMQRLNKKLMRLKAKEGVAPRDDWWQPQTTQPPILELTPLQVKAAHKKSRENEPPDNDNMYTQPNDNAPDNTQFSGEDDGNDFVSYVGKVMLALCVIIIVLLVFLEW